MKDISLKEFKRSIEDSEEEIRIAVQEVLDRIERDSGVVP